MKETKDACLHYNELPEGTRVFFEDLRGDDIALLKDGLRLVRATQTISKFMKWVVLASIGTFIAAVGLAENIMKVVGWFNGGGGSN